MHDRRYTGANTQQNSAESRGVLGDGAEDLGGTGVESAGAAGGHVFAMRGTGAGCAALFAAFY